MLRQFRLSFSLAAILFVGNGSAGAQNSPAPIPLDQQTNSQLDQLAGRVLDHPDGKTCHKKNCTILVANFVDRSGSTSLLGMQLADALSAQLAAKGVRTIERAKLQGFLEEERIPSKLLDDHAMAWLASRLSASAVLIGRLEQEGMGVHLRVRLLSAHGVANQEDEIGVDQTVRGVQDADRFLAPAEPFGDVLPVKATPQGEKIFEAGVNGTTMPSCYVRPDPEYSEGDRKAGFQGTIVLDVTVRPDERVEDIRMLRGAPFGLNDKARKTVAEWKCKPALLNGTPVFARVEVEVTFRLF
ncbi:MAG TPA: TonB family protein [Candidatus Dormibacteraeota bacterium]|nr:TonB family protein [Candidatus Dormibacteraeota bacterium]